MPVPRQRSLSRSSGPRKRRARTRRNATLACHTSESKENKGFFFSGRHPNCYSRYLTFSFNCTRAPSTSPFVLFFFFQPPSTRLRRHLDEFLQGHFETAHLAFARGGGGGGGGFLFLFFRSFLYRREYALSYLPTKSTSNCSFFTVCVFFAIFFFSSCLLPGT